MEGSNKFLGFLSYVAVAAVGIAMFVGSLLKKGSKAAGLLLEIAYYSAFFCIVLTSLLFCMKQKRMLLWIVWAVSMVLLVLGCFVL